MFSYLGGRLMISERVKKTIENRCFVVLDGIKNPREKVLDLFVNRRWFQSVRSRCASIVEATGVGSFMACIAWCTTRTLSPLDTKPWSPGESLLSSFVFCIDRMHCQFEDLASPTGFQMSLRRTPIASVLRYLAAPVRNQTNRPYSWR